MMFTDWVMKGNDVTVAVLDSGVNCTGPVPINCAGGGVSFLNGSKGTNTTDTDNHGTLVGAIIAGTTAPDLGVAPKARVLPVKIMQSNSFSVADLTLGIDWVVNHASTHPNLRIMNISVGTNYHWVGCNCDGADQWTIALELSLRRAKNNAKIVTFAETGICVYK